MLRRPIKLKQRLLGTGLMSRSASARDMMVCIWPLKNLTVCGFTAPSASMISWRAALSCRREHKAYLSA
jgi:hypothetical protein